jgi:hypothetical protein
VVAKDILFPNAPERLIKTVINIGAILEKILLLKMVSLFVFISMKNGL